MEGPPIRIERAKVGDEDKFVDLLIRSGDLDPDGKEMIARANKHYFDAIGRERIIWFAYADDLAPIGIVQLVLTSLEQDLANGQDTAELHFLKVVPEFMGQKVSSLLSAELETEARSRSIRQLTLEVAAENSQAIRIYEHWGYSFMRQGNKLLSENIQTIVMTKKLVN